MIDYIFISSVVCRYQKKEPCKKTYHQKLEKKKNMHSLKKGGKKQEYVQDKIGTSKCNNHLEAKK